MPTEDERRSPNAFTADFLSRMDDIGEPDGAHEAEVAGPWIIVPVQSRGAAGFALLREWESLDAGDLPYAVFPRRETALLAAAMLPATGREPLFRLATEPDPAGFPLWAAAAPPRPPRRRASAAPAADAAAAAAKAAAAAATPADGNAQGSRAERDQEPAHPATPRSEAAGHLRDFDEGLASALNLAAAVVRSPACLALLLEGAGSIALEQAGRILHRRIHRPGG